MAIAKPPVLYTLIAMPLRPDDIAASIEWIAGLPKHVNINQLEMMPTCQAPAGLAIDKTMQ